MTYALGDTVIDQVAFERRIIRPKRIILTHETKLRLDFSCDPKRNGVTLLSSSDAPFPAVLDMTSLDHFEKLHFKNVLWLTGV